MARQNFQATLLELYEDQKDCDIIFSCPSIDNFGNSIIGAHKRILAVASSVFYNMFYGPSAKTSDEQFNNVDIVDIEISTFKKFLRYFFLVYSRIYNNRVFLVSSMEARSNLNVFKLQANFTMQLININVQMQFSAFLTFCWRKFTGEIQFSSTKLLISLKMTN